MDSSRGRVALVALLCLVILQVVSADRGNYYRMLNDVNAGKNYFDLLQISPSANATEIRKAYKKLALQYHPDKNPDPESYQIYLDIVFAFEVLTSPSDRAQYEELLRDGIPWHEQYYGQYAHKFGAPDHDIRYVLLSVVIIITVLKHAYLYNHYYNTIALAKSHPAYIQQLHRKTRELETQRPKPSNLAGKRLKEYQDSLRKEADKLLEFEIVGLRKPTWQDIFIFDFVRIPYDIAMFFWAAYTDTRTKEQKEEDELRHRMGYTDLPDSEWKIKYQEHMERQEAYRTSNRGKRDRRWLKKYVPVNDYDWD